MVSIILRRLHEDQLLVSARGAITMHEDIKQIRDTFGSVIGKYAELQLDFSGVTRIDTAATETLVLIRSEALIKGTKIRLVGLSSRITLLLFVKIITTYGPPHILRSARS